MSSVAAILALALFLVGEGWFNLYLKPRRGFDFGAGYRSTIFHFGLWSLVAVAVVYWLYPEAGRVYEWLALGLAFVLYVSWFEHRLNRYLAARAAETLLQQGVILLLVLSAEAAGLSLALATVAFALVFTALHLPLIWLFPGQDEWVYVVGAFAASLVFPALLWSSPFGVLATFGIHYAFYVGLYLLRQERLVRAGVLR